jgi:hypothetical protein
MGAAEIRQALGVSSPRSSSKWINRGLEKNLIEPTTDREFDPTREYRLTSTGAARVDRLQSA